MKKILLTVSVLACMTALTKAQQGRVGINTTTPAATLDVTANTADTTRPDALLVPRMTEDQLAAKNTAYVDGTAGTPSAQNGALVYVTAVDGATTAKTVNVTATGFHYYDGTAGNNVWRPFGGGAPVNPALVVSAVQTASYVVPTTEDIILFNVNNPSQTVTLPTAGIPVGKRLYISNSGNTTIDIIPAPRELANTAIPTQQATTLIYLGGTGAGSWSYLSGF